MLCYFKLELEGDEKMCFGALKIRKYMCLWSTQAETLVIKKKREPEDVKTNHECEMFLKNVNKKK